MFFFEHERVFHVVSGIVKTTLQNTKEKCQSNATFCLKSKITNSVCIENNNIVVIG